MSRPLVILNSKANRETAANWCRNAPEGTQVEFRERLRTDDQNRKMWASLTDLARLVCIAFAPFPYTSQEHA